MVTLIIVLLVWPPLLFQKERAGEINEPALYEDTEAYEIYSQILPSEWPWRVANAKALVIRNVTGSYEMCLRPEKEWEDLIGPAISEYVKLNKKKWVLKQEFQIEKPYSLVTSDDINSALQQGSWEGFFKKYPDSGGWIEVSAVGFNADKTVAVVYMAHHCGLLCGGGQFHVLHKKYGKWVPLEWKGMSCSWAS